MKKQINHIMLFMLLVSGAAGLNAQTPLLNSYAPAAATVYLDFDGGTVNGTLWNEKGEIVFVLKPVDKNGSDIKSSITGNVKELKEGNVISFGPRCPPDCPPPPPPPPPGTK